MSAAAEISERFDALVNDGLDEVERLARAVLARKPTLDEYVMAMGTAFFVTRDGDTVPVDEVSQALRPAIELAAFLSEWGDDFLHLNGCAMRFTRTSERITKW